MKLEQKWITLIILITSGALLGLLGVQIHLFHRAVTLQHRIFDSSVNTALTQVVQELETRETLQHVVNFSVQYDIKNPREAQVSVVQRDAQSRQVNVELHDLSQLPSNARLDSNKVILHLNEKHKVRLVRMEQDRKTVTRIFEREMEPGLHEIPLDTATPRTISWLELFIDNSKHPIYLDKSTPGRLIIDPALDRKRGSLIDKVLEQYLIPDLKPIAMRIQFPVLDSLITATLAGAGIRQPCVYGILDSRGDSLVYSHSAGDNTALPRSPYRARLFPLDIRPSPYALAFVFPQQESTLMKQVALSAVSTIVFMLVIILSFIVVVRVLFAQQRFSRLIVDFINNMIHEFQTPLSTISVASETLRTARLKQDPQRQERFRNVIYEESQRMRKQVEKILEIAALEKGDMDLYFENLDIHGLITQAAQNWKIHIEKLNGSLSLHLQANNHIIPADSLHLLNVLNNLIDNAVKYTKEKPVISIATQDEDRCLRLSVQDHGIGIPRDALKSIFQKYYRVPQGRVHDVKGFGLGLSYVKSIMDAHKGRIEVESDLGRGTTVHLYLPIKDGADK
jgi:two-component system, OmpR family, phosphate regulon sensor histidine kinase PhoR